MKNIIHFLKKYGFLRLVAFGGLFFVMDSFAMKRLHEEEHPDMRDVGMVKKVRELERVGFYDENGDLDKIVWVNKEFVLNNSNTLKNMLKDLGEEEINRIPLQVSFDVIHLAFDVLQNYVAINTLSLEQLVSVANVFNFLDVPRDKMHIVLKEISKHMINKYEKNNKVLEQLNVDLQKVVIAESAINCLQYCIANKKFKWELKSELLGVVDDLWHYNADQALFIFQVCLLASKNQVIVLNPGTRGYNLFMKLPIKMRNFLEDLFVGILLVN